MPAILREGMMVGVRVGSAAPWHGNIIYEVSGNSIRIAYMDKFMKGVAEPGCLASLKFSNDYFIYYFSGTVKSISSDIPQSVCLRLDSMEEMINNRLFPRYDVKLKAELKPVWDDEVYECTVTDISYGGAAFVCEHKFDSNEHIEMALQLSGNVIVKITGKVIRRRSSGSSITDHAAQFIECDNTSNKLLSEYFSRLEEEVSEIYQRYITEYKNKY